MATRMEGSHFFIRGGGATPSLRRSSCSCVSEKFKAELQDKITQQPRFEQTPNDRAPTPGPAARILATQPPSEEAGQVKPKLDVHANRHNVAPGVRREPTWILYDLKRARSATFVHFIAPHLVLIEGQARVSQRMIHVNVDLARLGAGRVFNPHAAPKILWDVGAAINFVGGVEQGHRK